MPGEIRLGCAMIVGFLFFAYIIVILVRLILAKWWKLYQRKFWTKVYEVSCIFIALVISFLIKPSWIQGVAFVVWLLIIWKMQSSVRKDVYNEEMAGRIQFDWKNYGQPVGIRVKKEERLKYEAIAKQNDAEWSGKAFWFCGIIPIVIIDILSILVYTNVIDNFMLFLLE